MEKCLVCQHIMREELSFSWLFSLKKLQEKYICADCYKSFVLIQDKKCCCGCGRSQMQETLCYDCIRWKKNGQMPLLKNRALFVYNKAMQNFMEEYKFKGDYYWRFIFQDFFEKSISRYYNSAWFYVPIPVDKPTLTDRGFNQVTGLLRKLPYEEILKMKELSERTKQSHKNRRERLATKQPFEYTGNKNIVGKKILLLDDIYTTGRTLYYAKEILIKEGAREVRSFTLAR